MREKKKQVLLAVGIFAGICLLAGSSIWKKRNQQLQAEPEKSEEAIDLAAQETEEKEEENKEEAVLKTEDGKIKKVVAYYPSWKEGEENLDKLRFDIITHVVYAFAIPTEEGSLRPLENAELAQEILNRAHSRKAKVLLGVGGWSYQEAPLESTFESATNTPEKIKRLGDSILSMVAEYGFDGVDMDWEFPNAKEASEAQYEALMGYLSERLHEAGKAFDECGGKRNNPKG